MITLRYEGDVLPPIQETALQMPPPVPGGEAHTILSRTLSIGRNKPIVLEVKAYTEAEIAAIRAKVA